MYSLSDKSATITTTLKGGALLDLVQFGSISGSLQTHYVHQKFEQKHNHTQHTFDLL